MHIHTLYVYITSKDKNQDETFILRGIRTKEATTLNTTNSEKNVKTAEQPIPGEEEKNTLKRVKVQSNALPPTQLTNGKEKNKVGMA